MLKMIKNYFRQHFGFSRSEQRGLIVLIPLMLLLLFVPQLVKKYYLSQPDDHLANDQKLLKEWYDQTMREQNMGSAPQNSKAIRFFDPNQISKTQWLSLGFRPAVVERILKYRRTGARFYKKTDLFKIYGISERLVNRYQDYIIINKPKPRQKTDWRSKIKKDLPVSDDRKPIKEKKFVLKTPLNLADTTALRQVKGIGPYLSKKIIERRDELGGYSQENQLMEVFLLDSAVIEKLLERFQIAGDHIRKIDINSISYDSLINHPYFSYKLSRVIINYRQQHGAFNSTEDLLKIHILTDSVYAKIEPYIAIIKSE